MSLQDQFLKFVSDYLKGSKNKIEDFKRLVETTQVRAIYRLTEVTCVQTQNSIILYHHGLRKCIYRFKSQTSFGKNVLYHAQMFQMNKQMMVLLVLTEQVLVIRQTKIIVKIAIPQVLYIYRNIYINPKNYIINIIGETYNDEFSIILTALLFNSSSSQKLKSRKLLPLAITPASIFQNTGMQFGDDPHIPVKIEKICYYRDYTVFLYNKRQSQLYLCDYEELFMKYQNLDNLLQYNDGFLSANHIYHYVPFQGIHGVYTNVRIQKIETDQEFITLTVEAGPIKREETLIKYRLDPDLNLIIH
ncbi:hypothetical protein pb186bvf_001524 [Paramecium bursaria]